jgi:hypothetical protein
MRQKKGFRYKKKADVINAIPSDMDLLSYFLSLSNPEREMLMEELKVAQENLSVNNPQYVYMLVVCYLVSISCYFGVREYWFMAYLFAINLVVTLLYMSTLSKARPYKKSLRLLSALPIS